MRVATVVAAAVVANEVLVVLEIVVVVGMVILDRAQLLSRPYPAFLVFFLHQHHPAGPQTSFSRSLDAALADV